MGTEEDGCWSMNVLIHSFQTFLGSFPHDFRLFCSPAPPFMTFFPSYHCRRHTFPCESKLYVILIIIPTFLLRSDSVFSPTAGLFSSNLSILGRCLRLFSSAINLVTVMLCLYHFGVCTCLPSRPSRVHSYSYQCQRSRL